MGSPKFLKKRTWGVPERGTKRHAGALRIGMSADPLVATFGVELPGALVPGKDEAGEGLS